MHTRPTGVKIVSASKISDRWQTLPNWNLVQCGRKIIALKCKILYGAMNAKQRQS